MQKGLTYILSYFVIVCMLSSCSTGNKFASSFGKRKYLKGYYVDVPAGTKEPEIASNSNKPSNQAISNKGAGHVYLTNQVITIKSKGSITVISGKNSNTITAISKAEKTPDKQEKSIQQQAIKTAPHATDDGKYADAKHEVNLWAILGCALAIAAAVIAAISGSFTLISIIVMSLAGIICIYGLFQNKFYYTWLSIIGLSIIIFMLVLIIY